MSALFVFGFGYSAEFIAARLVQRGWAIAGTARAEAGLDAIRARGFTPIAFTNRNAVAQALHEATHLLISTPPVEGKDPALGAYAEEIKAAKQLTWLGYLSTVGVYGDRGGAWVDEATPVKPDLGRSLARVDAEHAFMTFCKDNALALDIFRLSGIYGPGRSPLDRVAEGRAQRVMKPGQVFNRIHVEDIAETVVAAIAKPGKSSEARVFNVTDDEPAPPQDVTAFATSLLGVPLPPEVAFEDADLSSMARSFYEDNKRVGNAKIKRELGVTLAFPTYREGLTELAKARQNSELLR